MNAANYQCKSVMCVNKIHCSCQLSHNVDDTLRVNPGVTLKCIINVVQWNKPSAGLNIKYWTVCFLHTGWSEALSNMEWRDQTLTQSESCSMKQSHVWAREFIAGSNPPLLLCVSGLPCRSPTAPPITPLYDQGSPLETSPQEACGRLFWCCCL